MVAALLPMWDRGIAICRARTRGVDFGDVISAWVPSRHQHNQNPTVWPPFGNACCPFGTSVPNLAWRIVRLHGVGTPVPGHDVFGTGWQIFGRAMQPVTTMMPV